jgi:predicted nucleic acid-binding protein
MFRAKWSNAIHDEWIENLLKNRPDLTKERLQKTRSLMDHSVLDALVTGYEALIDGIELPDPRDRHVLAAAMVSKASCIVTFNLKHFPEEILQHHGLHAVHPDDFVLDVEGLDTLAFANAVAQDFQHYKRPKLQLSEYVSALENAGIPKTAATVQKLAVIIDT